jgi:hypothetical protein
MDWSLILAHGIKEISITGRLDIVDINSDLKNVLLGTMYILMVLVVGL